MEAEGPTYAVLLGRVILPIALGTNLPCIKEPLWFPNPGPIDQGSGHEWPASQCWPQHLQLVQAQRTSRFAESLQEQKSRRSDCESPVQFLGWCFPLLICPTFCQAEQRDSGARHVALKISSHIILASQMIPKSHAAYCGRKNGI